MKALSFDGKLQLKEVSKPRQRPGEALIKVTYAGICNTDHEILRGYMPGFIGIPGHEFVGIVESAESAGLVNKRVTAEINCSCGSCEWCRKGLGRHCPQRTVLGIYRRDGVFAEHVTVPEENIIEIPETIPDNRTIFIEPLAAALEILEQVPVHTDSSVLLLGDGKLGQLIATVLASTGCGLTVVGRHPEKLGLLEQTGAETVLLDDFKNSGYDIVVEATGSPSGFKTAVANVKPRGTLILKSTFAKSSEINLSPIVVNEVTIVGSRCGKFKDAIDFILKHNPTLERLISAEFDLEDGLKAFEFSERPEVMKVILKVK